MCDWKTCPYTFDSWCEDNVKTHLQIEEVELSHQNYTRYRTETDRLESFALRGWVDQDNRLRFEFDVS